MNQIMEATVNMIVRFLNEYGTQLLYAALTALAGGTGVLVRQIFTRRRNRRIRQRVVQQCMWAAAQVYGDLPEKERRMKTVSAISEALSDRGIRATEPETMLCMLQERYAAASEAPSALGTDVGSADAAKTETAHVAADGHRACVPLSKPYSPA